MVFVWIIIGIGIFLLTALVFCIAPGKMSPEAKKTSKIFFGLNCAHRGLHSEDQKIPENSLPAFAAARQGGYGVELDVQLSKDNQVVVFHDDDLERVCGVDARVNSKTLKELSELKLLDSDEKIPLFTDVLEVLDDTPVIVELKSAGPMNTKLCEETLKILREQGKYWCIESFDPRIGAWFRKNAPDVLRGQLSCPPGKFDGISKIKSILLGNLLTNFMSRPHFIAFSNTRRPLTVKLCHSMKPMKAIWTVLPTADIAECERENDTVIFEYYEPSPTYR
ncbi:MAG: glycerophosphodiester phosphodiesterase [Oscillospiraceae bacterium]|nr:glycerophosphodiester phosphodiesterase [Oscillospiraceae bacterium]